MLAFNVQDVEPLTRWLSRFPGVYRRATRSALSSVGWFTQQKIKDYGQAHSYSGMGWPRLNPHTRAIKSMVRRDESTERYKTKSKKHLIKPKKSKSQNPMSNIVNAARYSVVMEDDEAFTEIGFHASPRAARAVASAAESATTHVTPAMRRFLFAVGFPLKKSTHILHKPARPWIEPVLDQEHHELPRRFEEKFWDALRRYQKEARK